LSKGLILSLFDYTGNWSKYFRENGFRVIKHGTDILTWQPPDEEIFGILAAPPCTDFSVSGAQYWKTKDADGRTAQSVRLVTRTMEIINQARGLKFWILENPVGRLKQWIGLPKTYVHPYEFAGYAPNPEEDRYTKKTCLWGNFRLPPKKPLPPIRVCSQGSWLQKLGGVRQNERASI
jgi:hypothetical protein